MGGLKENEGVGDREMLGVDGTVTAGVVGVDAIGVDVIETEGEWVRK